MLHSDTGDTVLCRVHILEECKVVPAASQHVTYRPAEQKVTGADKVRLAELALATYRLTGQWMAEEQPLFMPSD